MAGYASALNLVHTSEYYNKEVMREKETEIQSRLKRLEQKQIKKNNAGRYITFDASVTANWEEVTDNTIASKIKSQTAAAMKASNEQKDEILKKLVSDLGKERDPKFCKSVQYVVGKVKLHGSNGEVIIPVPFDFNKNIGEDTNLKDVLKKQNS
jgi:cytochrome c oxidase assembly protein Cox11